MAFMWNAVMLSPWGKRGLIASRPKFWPRPRSFGLGNNLKLYVVKC